MGSDSPLIQFTMNYYFIFTCEFLIHKFNKTRKIKKQICVVTRYMACMNTIAAFSVLAVRGRLLCYPSMVG